MDAKNYRTGLCDKATGETVVACKIVDITEHVAPCEFRVPEELTILAYIQSSHGMLVQIAECPPPFEKASRAIHYELDGSMLTDDLTRNERRFSIYPGTLGRLIQENRPNP